MKKSSYKVWPVCFFIISRGIVSLGGHSSIGFLTNLRKELVKHLFFLNFMGGEVKNNFS